MRALLLAALALAAAADNQARLTKLGGGSQKAVVSAARVARQRDPEACFTGMSVSRDPHANGVSKAIDVMRFYFRRPGKDLGLLVMIADGKEAELNNDESKAGDFDCVTEMSVDSGDAVDIAFKTGYIEHGIESGFTALLRPGYGDNRNGLRNVKQVKGRTVWQVHGETSGRCVYVDAASGAVLLKSHCMSYKLR